MVIPAFIQRILEVLPVPGSYTETANLASDVIVSPFSVLFVATLDRKYH
jgi:hypothetical protein